MDFAQGNSLTHREMRQEREATRELECKVMLSPSGHAVRGSEIFFCRLFRTVSNTVRFILSLPKGTDRDEEHDVPSAVEGHDATMGFSATLVRAV